MIESGLFSDVRDYGPFWAIGGRGGGLSQRQACGYQIKGKVNGF